MSASEILVIAVGVFLGYWIVSKLIGGDSSRDTPAPPAAGNPAETHRSETAIPLAWHEVLDVDRTASVAQIHAAYEAQRRQFQPEQVAHLAPDLQALAQQRTRAIEAAYHEALRERGHE